MTITSHRIRNAKGFTLIELMIVVVIIGILAAIAIPRFAVVTRQSKESEAPPVLRQIYTLQERYKQRHDQFAADFTDLEGGADYDGSKYVYYSFRMQGTPTGFQACAVPKDASLGLSTMVVDQSRRQVRAAACAF